MSNPALSAVMTIGEVIDDFLAQKRIAVVGVSRNPADFSRSLFRELHQRGYDLVPVNPEVSYIEDELCFARVQDIQPPVEAVLIMTPPQATEQVVRDCAAAGIKRVWLHRGAGQGAVSQEALDFCRQRDLQVVPGYCPFMFLPDTGFIHRAHGLVLKLVGAYPR